MLEVVTMSCHAQRLTPPRQQKLMDASVLVGGNNEFLAILAKWTSSLVTGAVVTTSRLDEIVLLIETGQPDILILQNSSRTLDLIRHIRQQSQVSWIYCIFIECYFHSTVIEKLPEKKRHLLNKLQALENGADAYLQTEFLRYLDLDIELAEEDLIIEECLLKAQIQVGLRQVRTCRELMRTNDLLSSIALADPLTEVNNRRALEWELPRQIQKAHSNSVPLSLIILDVDYFKAINDSHGHLVGDRVLQLLSARIQHNLRGQDTLFRYGGEEFVVILGNTASQEAHLVAQRLCRLIAEQPFNVDGTLALNVTVSIGTAYLKPTDDTQGTSLLRRADENLLKAKAAGRNRVISELED